MAVKSFAQWSSEKKKKQVQQGEEVFTPALAKAEPIQNKPLSFTEWSTQKKASSIVNENYINTFISDAGNYLNNAKSDYDSIGWKNASSAFEARRASMNDLDQRAKYIESWLQQNHEGMKPGARKILVDALRAYNTNAPSVLQSFKNAADYYGQFETEDAYKAHVKARDEYNKKVAPFASAKDADDFEYYSNLGATFENPTYKQVENGIQIFGWRSGKDEDVKNIVTYSRDNAEQIGLGEAEGHDRFGDYRYSFMTDDEVALYNYYLAKYGEKKAQSYLDAIYGYLKDRHEGKIIQNVSEFANDSPVLGSAVSVFTSLGSGAEYITDLFNYAVGRDETLDTNLSADVTNTIRGTVSEQASFEIAGWDAGAFLYNTGMSMADSLTAGLTFGGAGGAVLGLSAAAQGTNDALNRGMSDGRAFWNGLVSGVFEGLFETVSIGKFNALKEVTPITIKDIAKNIGKSMLVNASEESLTEIANIAYDTIVNGKFANYTLEDLSKAGTWADIGRQVVEAGLSGALMGFGMGGAGSAIGYTNGMWDGSMLTKEYGYTAEDVVAEAMELDPSNPLAGRLQGKLDAGKKVTGAELSAMVRENEATMRKQDTSSIQNAAEARLTELGEKGNVRELAAILAKQASGEKLTRAEKKALDGSTYGGRVANELNTENIGSGEYSNAWAQKIGTQRINADEYSRLVQAAEMPSEGQNTAAEELPTDAISPSSAQAVEAVEAPTATADEMEMVNPAKDTTVPTKATVTEETQETEAVSHDQLSKKYGAQAGAMLHTYTEGQDVESYDRAYSAAYDMGKSGVSLSYAMESQSTAYLTEGQRELAYEAGKAAAEREAHEQDAKNKQAANGKSGRRKGSVKGEGVKIADLKETFNDPQGKAFKYLSAVAEVTGIDIVLYKSEAGEGGTYEGAQGKFKWSEDTIYIDVNAGLYYAKDADKVAKYAMLRTFSHEFTHFIEKWNPIWYNEFRKTVFDTLAEQGENVHELIEEKQLQSEGLTYDQASRELVAESMTDILPDANFVRELAEKHQNIFQKLLEQFKEFVENLRAYFNGLVRNPSREANALKEQVGETVRYLESIVKLFDNVALEAVENYQAAVVTEEAATAESETTAEKIDSTEAINADQNADFAGNLQNDVVAPTETEDFTSQESTEQTGANSEEKDDNAPSENAVEQAKRELRKAVRMPIKGTNEEALLEGIKSGDLSMESITYSGNAPGFDEVQREHLVKKLVEGVYTDSETIKIDVPYDGKFEIDNTPGNVAKVLNKLKVKVNQEVLLDKTTLSILSSNGTICIAEVNGQKYMTNGSLLLPATDAVVSYLKTEHDAKGIDLQRLAEAFNTEGELITKAPMEAVYEGHTVLVFDMGGQKHYFDKRAFSLIDGGKLYLSQYRGFDLIRSVDANGSVKGYLVNVRIKNESDLADPMPTKLRSFPQITKSEKKASPAKSEKRASTSKTSENTATEPTVTEVTEVTKPPETVETTVKLEDFGEKIGGARKDEWGKRGLLSTDLAVMNDRERDKAVKKDNVWKRPDYRKLIEGGEKREILFARNEIRKSLNQNLTYLRSATAESKLELQKVFVDTVREIQAMAEKATTAADIKAMGYDWLLKNGYLQLTNSYRSGYSYTDKWRKNPALHLSNYVQTVEHLVRNFDKLGRLADQANFAVDAEAKVPAGYSIHEDDRDHTWYIAKGRYVVRYGLVSYDEALTVLKNAASATKKKTRFVPKQLLGVHRKGPDYRAGKDVAGQDYLDTFGFKGGEFGNWMSEKDRRVSMNYGFDALKDLADALGIADGDISLSGNLSIAFGARGQGLSGAAAHYERERHVINLTKMNGAGSLAHEWFHALDDFAGGYGNNMSTDNLRTLPAQTQAAMRSLLSTMQYRDATQEESDMAATKRYEQAKRSVEYQVKSQFGWVEKLENGKLTDSDARYFARKPTEADAKRYHELLDKLLATGDASVVDELSALRKEVNGHVIAKENREAIGYRLLSLTPSETQTVQKMRLRSDYYNNSRLFGELHQKDGDYWDSTVEMAARAFACYVTDKTNAQNDYLSAHSDSAVTFTADKSGNPVIVKAFPEGKERIDINHAFDELIEAMKADGILHDRGETVKPDMVQYQARNYLSAEAVAFREDIDEWDTNGRPTGETFILGSTGDVLQGLGAIDNDIYMLSDKINAILKYHPEMTLDEIKKIPQILENPILVLASRNAGRENRANSRLVMFGTVKAQNGLPVLTVLDLKPIENHIIVDDMQKVSSAYTKDNDPVNFVKQSRVLFTEETNKTAKLLRAIGFQNAYRIANSGYIGSISYDNNTVNISGKNFSEIFTEITDDTVQNQQRRPSLTDREVLSMAVDEVQVDGLNPAEQDALSIFKQRLHKLDTLQEQRVEQGRLYKEQQFGVKVDRAAASETLNRMHVLDEQIKKASADLLSVEEKTVLKQVLQKARKVVESQERQHSQEMLARWRDRRNNAAAIKKYRDRLRGDVDDLTNWVLHPNNKDIVKHIPDALKNSVIPFLSSINFMSKRSLSGGSPTVADKEFMNRLNGLKSALRQNADAYGLYSGYNDLPPDFMDRLQTLIDAAQKLVDNNSGEFIINQMTSDELRELSKVVRTLKKFIKSFNLFHANAMYQHVYEAGNDTIQSLDAMKSDGGKSGTVSNFVLWQQMRPAFAFERFGQGGVAIYDGLRRGQAKLAFNAREIRSFAEKTYTAKEVQAWEKEIKTINLGGDTVKMPVSIIMSFYELSKRPQALGHILGQGIRVATVKMGKRKISDIGHIITEQDIVTIISTLTDRQKEVADALQKYMAEQGGKWGNYVSVKRFGEELFGEPTYFPIHSDGRHLQANADENPSAASLYALLNMSFTKELTKEANNRIILYSIFDVFANHMASMAQYNAMALPVLDAIKWFNYRQKSEAGNDGEREVIGSVRDQMARVYGTPEETRPGSGKQGYAETFVMNILKAFNGTEAQGVPSDAMGINFNRGYNMAQVAFNLRVVVQQPLAITRAALLVGYDSMLRGLKLSPSAIQKNIAEMQQYSGIAAWKSLGFYDINISRGITETIKHSSTIRDKISEVGMWGAEKADLLTWAAIWSACKEEVIHKQRISPKNEGFYDAVTQLFEDVIYKTQVVDSILTKNEFLRSKGAFARLVGSFMSEPTATASMLVNAYDNYGRDRQRGMSRQGAWQKNRKLIVRTAYVYGVSAILLAAVQATIDALRDDDEYEEYPEKWLEAFWGNFVDELMPFNKLPIVSDFYDLAKELLSIFGVDTYGNPPQSVFMQWYDSLVKGVEIIYDKITGEDNNYTWYGGAYKLLQAVSGMSGLPMASATREIITAWNNTVGTMAHSLKVQTYDPGDKNEIKYAYMDGYLTAEEATDLLIEKGIADTEDEAYWIIEGWDAGEGFSPYDALYEAMRSSASIDSAMDEMTSHGYEEEQVLKQAKNKIGEWYSDGEITKQQAISMLEKYTDLTGDEITAIVNRWSSKVVTGIAYGDIDDAFMEGTISADRAKEMYMRYGGMTAEKAAEKVTVLAFVKEYPQFEAGDLTYSMVKDYRTYCETTGIDVKVFYDAWKYKNSLSGSVKEPMMQYINGLPLSARQKDSLYYAFGWAESKINDAPWR